MADEGAKVAKRRFGQTLAGAYAVYPSTRSEDLALIVDTYHHLPNRVAYFTELKRSLKRGGRVAIVDFRKGAPSGPPEEFRFTADQISAEMAEAGFSLQTTHEFLPRQIFLVFAVR